MPTVLGIDVDESVLQQWAAWLAPCLQPFFVESAAQWPEARVMADAPLSAELRDTFKVWRLRDRGETVWLDEPAFHALDPQCRRRLVRSQAERGRGAVPLVRRWSDILDVALLRRQGDGHRFVWWPSLLDHATDVVLARFAAEEGDEARHRQAPEPTWRTCDPILPGARTLAGTFAVGSGPNCFGTVMAAAGVDGADAAWMQQPPFDAWLASACIPGGRDEEPGTVLVWRDSAGLPRACCRHDRRRLCPREASPDVVDATHRDDRRRGQACVAHAGAAARASSRCPEPLTSGRRVGPSRHTSPRCWRTSSSKCSSSSQHRPLRAARACHTRFVGWDHRQRRRPRPHVNWKQRGVADMSPRSELPGVIVHHDAFNPSDDRPWIPFPDGVVYLRRRHHELIAACIAWAATAGRPLDPDVLAVLCGAGEEGFNGGSVTRWTVERMYHMLCCHIPNWCDDHHAEVPDDVFKEPLWLLVNFLVATDRLDDESDPPDLLFQVLRCHGINADGFESDDEADWHYEDAPFEYDGPSHGELKRQRSS